MNKDLQLFEKIIDHLIYLTTKDEYGSSRSRGIGTHDTLAADLNQEGINPKTGSWTENSLRLFLNRLPKRYDEDTLEKLCDLSFIGRSSWEYQSQTRREEIMGNPRGNHSQLGKTGYTRSYPMNQPERTEIENWKSHEVQEVHQQNEKYEKILESETRKRRFVK